MWSMMPTTNGLSDGDWHQLIHSHTRMHTHTLQELLQQMMCDEEGSCRKHISQRFDSHDKSFANELNVERGLQPLSHTAWHSSVNHALFDRFWFQYKLSSFRSHALFVCPDVKGKSCLVLISLKSQHWHNSKHAILHPQQHLYFSLQQFCIVATWQLNNHLSHFH